MSINFLSSIERYQKYPRIVIIDFSSDLIIGYRLEVIAETAFYVRC